MMKMTAISYLILLCSFSSRAVDMMYVPNVTAAFKAHNIVSGEVVSFSEDTRTYTFVVDNSFKGTGIDIGQTITIHQPRYGALQVNDGDNDKKYLLYLTKNKNNYVLYSRTQNVYTIKDNYIPFATCGKTYKMRDHEFRSMLKDLFKCFEYESMYKFKTKVSRVAYYSDDQHHDAVLSFYACHDNAESGQFIEEPPVMAPENQVDEIQVDEISDFCEVDPKPINGTQGLMDYIKTAIPDSVFTQEDRGSTRWYVRFVVEMDSSISNVEMAKSFNSKYDKMILEIVEKMDKWVPGQNYNQPVRCRATIPVVVRLE